MNQLSINEFSLLNDEEKLKIFENIQSSIELHKKNYFKNNNEEIPIRAYYPKNYFFSFQKENEKNNYEVANNLLYSFSDSSNSDEKENKLNIINKAKNNLIEIKKEIENIKNIKKINKSLIYNKEKNGKELDTNSNGSNNLETFPEVNYIIESTTNSYNSTKKDKTIFNNYIDYSKEYTNINKNKININKENNYKNNYDSNPNLLNNNILTINLNNIELYKNNKFRNNENNYINKRKSFENKNTKKNKIIKNKALIYEKYFNIFNNNKTLNERNNYSKENNLKIKIDLKPKFDKVYLFKDKIKNILLKNNNKYSYKNEHKEKKENFNNNKNLKITTKNNPKKNNNLRKETYNRNDNKDNKVIRYKSLNNKKRININDISNKLYNMEKIIKDKINKKKQEIEENEMRNCTFKPKINIKSKKIMEKLDFKKKNLLEVKESKENIEKEIRKERYGIGLIPRYNKSFNNINHNKGNKLFSKNKVKSYNKEYDELKECTFRPTINKNNSINYFTNRNNYQINQQQENNYKEDNKENNNYEKDYINKPSNIKKSFSQLNNQISNYLYKKEKFENNNFSKYNNSNEKNFCKYFISENINNTDTNYNYSIFRDNLSSKNILINNNNKKEKEKFLMNIFYNENDAYLYKPKIYKNGKYINMIYNSRNKEEMNQIKKVDELRNIGNIKEKIKENIINSNINSFRPIKLKENERNQNIGIQITKGEIMKTNVHNSNPKNKEVYIKKNVKYHRNYSHTNRNNYLSLNDRDELFNNRIVIHKLLLEEVK